MSHVPAADVALGYTVAFVNTYDLLASPPDHLTVEDAREVAVAAGHPEIARRLRAGDLAALRETRGRLYAVFAGETIEDKAAALNAVLAERRARAVAAVAGDRVRLSASGGEGGAVGALAVVLADALARALAAGPDRLRTCAANPCRCAYIDRTRGNRQRYCCELCNDRMAASAYRRRQRAASGDG